jgi:3-mercaptopyruvate sulfurtransferase SseA
MRQDSHSTRISGAMLPRLASVSTKSPLARSDNAAAMSLFRQDLPRARHLVTAVWLARLAAGQDVEQAPAGAWCLFEVGTGPPAAFWGGHIAGAGYIDTDRVELPPLWNALTVPSLQTLWLHLGIGPGSTVVLYGRTTAAAGRVAHLLMLAGVADVRLLDGGLAAWCAAGLPLQAGEPAVYPPRQDPMNSFRARPELLMDTAQVRARLGRPDVRLVSIRTWAEFTGRTSGYSYIEARGEIAGAVWGHAGEDGDIHSVRSFQEPDGRMLPAAALAGLWAHAGIVPERHTIFYCGTGWRASVAFFYAWLMGWDPIAVYDGGWLEWSSDPANPTVIHGAAAQVEPLVLTSPS